MQGNELTTEELVARALGRLVGALAPEPCPLAELDQQFVNDLGYDSMRMVELSFMLEELFSLSSSAMNDMPPVGTVRDLVAYTTTLVEAGRATMPTDEAVGSAAARI